jgi:hypothetical protein
MATKKTVSKKAVRKTAVRKKTVHKGAWVVTTSADRPIAEVAKDLSAAGFVVDQTLDQIGVITGKSDHRGVKKARAIRGVADVSPEHTVDIGPPNSRDTW